MKQHQSVYFEATMVYFEAVRTHTFHIDVATQTNHFHFLLTNQKKKALKRFEYNIGMKAVPFQPVLE